jgi:hypothetical protein
MRICLLTAGPGRENSGRVAPKNSVISSPGQKTNCRKNERRKKQLQVVAECRLPAILARRISQAGFGDGQNWPVSCKSGQFTGSNQHMRKLL